MAVFLFQFQYRELLKFLYPCLHVIINFYVFIMLHFFRSNQPFALGIMASFLLFALII